MEICLTQGKVTLVDEGDYEWLSQWKWFAKQDYSTGKFYAARQLRLPQGQRVWEMHRQILGLEIGDPRQGDHIEPIQTLDNRRSNLRIAATRALNIANRRKMRNNTTGFKGVFKERGGKFIAAIGVNGRRVHLGTRPTAELAYVELYCPAAIKHYGEFARID